jgi:hypothetical protein
MLIESTQKVHAQKVLMHPSRSGPMKVILPLLLFLFLLQPASAQVIFAAAQDPEQQNNLLTPEPDEREPPVSRRQASDIARDSFPAGRVVSIRLDERHWRVRMDENGTVFNVFVDAQSGAVSRASEQE